MVGFHAEISAFAGGFIGVDVFFVISGFLISGIILDALAADKFTYADFYARRINRIFPALISVVLATCIAGVLVLFPPELESVGKHVIGGAAFVSNFVLWSETSYFESGAKPLLHLWSLAVEEQFYLVWPLVLMVAWKRRWNVSAIVSAIIAASFGWSIWQINYGDSNAAFYLPGARFWEIASGALLCIRFRSSGGLEKSLPPSVRNVLSIAGLCLLLAGLAVVDKDTPWPSWLTLLPVGGALCLIAAGSGSLVNQWFLSRRILVGIGLISYPLYLWHWPVLVIARLINEGQLTRTGRLSMIGLSIGLAVATYRFVEIPIRFGAHKKRSAARLLFAMAAVAGIGCLLLFGIVPSRLTAAYKKVAVTAAVEPFKGGGFDPEKRLAALEIAGDPNWQVAIVGDSHAGHYNPRFRLLAREKLRNMPTTIFYTYGACPPILGVKRVGKSWDGSLRKCNQYFRQVFERLKSPLVKTVVIVGFWEGYFGEFPIAFDDATHSNAIKRDTPEADSVFALLESEISTLRQEGKTVYLVLTNPNSEDNQPSKALPRRLSWLPPKHIVPAPRRPMDERSGWIRTRLIAVARASGARVIDPMAFLCDANECPTSDNGIPRYRDAHHFLPAFAERLTFLDTVLTR